MDTHASRCLLCLTTMEPETISLKVEHPVQESSSSFYFQSEQDGAGKLISLVSEPERVDPSGTINSILQKQLDVIFLLKNVLQIPPSQLRRYLKIRGNPDAWIVLCDSCKVLVKNVKKIFTQLQRISNEYEKAKKKVEEIIRAADKLEETHKDIILFECRKFVCKNKALSCKRDSSPQILRFEMYDTPVENEDLDPLSTCEAYFDDDHHSPASSRSGVSDKNGHESDADWDYKIDSNAKKRTRAGVKDSVKLPNPSINTRSLRKRKFKISSSEEKSKSGQVQIAPKRSRKAKSQPKSKSTKKKEPSQPTPKKIFDEAEMIKELTCHVCQKLLKNRKGLKLHLFKIHGIFEGQPPKTYKCPEEGCGKILYQKTMLNDHLQWHQKVPTCSICKKDFKSQKILDRHEYIAHKIVKPTTKNMQFFECSKCGKRFYTSRKEKIHSATCKGKAEEPVECDICQVTCPTSKDLRIHKKHKHGIIPEESGEVEEVPDIDPDNCLPCPLCGKLYIGEERLDDHLKKVHVENNDNLKSCTLCSGKEFKNQPDLDRHMARYHDVGTDDFLCRLCGTFCRTRTERKRHVCRTSGAPKFPCDICGKDFKDNSHMRRHIAHVHEKQLKASCDLCEYRGASETHVTRHKATRHCIGIKCEFEECPRYFASQKDLEEHVKKIHFKDERERSFLCTECGKGFYDEKSLKIHIQAIHENRESKPFKCHMCFKGFARAAYLAGHMKLHTVGHRRRNVKYLKNKVRVSKPNRKASKQKASSIDVIGTEAEVEFCEVYINTE